MLPYWYHMFSFVISALTVSTLILVYMYCLKMSESEDVAESVL